MAAHVGADSDRLDSIRGHGRGSHVGPEATTGPMTGQTGRMVQRRTAVGQGRPGEIGR